MTRNGDSLQKEATNMQMQIGPTQITPETLVSLTIGGSRDVEASSRIFVTRNNE